jgi:DNA modification methylase
LFSKPGDLVLDPYMGGGTAVVEGVAAGRHMVGNDLNSLGAFIARVKITALNKDDAIPGPKGPISGRKVTGRGA